MREIFINDKRYDILFKGHFVSYTNFKYIDLSKEISEFVKKKYIQRDLKTPPKLNPFISENVIKMHKDNGYFRKLTRIDLDKYLNFIEKTLDIECDLFNELYEKLENEGVCTVLSKIYKNEGFHTITDDYNNYLEDFIESVFTEASKSNFNINDINFNFRFDFLYNFKIDLQNFYSSIYTHWLERIVKIKYCDYYSTFSDEAKEYIKWLDVYNKSINGKQTNGIITGCYSSQITQEIFSTHLDFEITKLIKENFPNETIKYTRFVDDYIFYYNKPEIMNSLMNLLSDLFFVYDLMINPTKVETQKLGVTFNDNNYINSKDLIKSFENEVINFYNNNSNYDNSFSEEKRSIKEIFYSNTYNDGLLIKRIKEIYQLTEKYILNNEYSKAKTLLSLFISKFAFDDDNEKIYDGVENSKIRKLIRDLDLDENHFLFLCRTAILYPAMSMTCTSHLVVLKEKNFINRRFNYKNEIKSYSEIIKRKYESTMVMEMVNYTKLFKI